VRSCHRLRAVADTGNVVYLSLYVRTPDGRVWSTVTRLCDYVATAIVSKAVELKKTLPAVRASCNALIQLSMSPGRTRLRAVAKAQISWAAQ
jgi:hypothetical protein